MDDIGNAHIHSQNLENDNTFTRNWELRATYQILTVAHMLPCWSIVEVSELEACFSRSTLRCIGLIWEWVKGMPWRTMRDLMHEVWQSKVWGVLVSNPWNPLESWCVSCNAGLKFLGIKESVAPQGSPGDPKHERGTPRCVQLASMQPGRPKPFILQRNHTVVTVLKSKSSIWKRLKHSTASVVKFENVPKSLNCLERI